MSIYTRVLRTPAVYWPPGPTGPNGRPTYRPPVQILCRWVETNEEIIKTAGREEDSRAVVNPDRDLELGGILFRGRLADLTPEQLADPAPFFEGWEIKKYQRVPGISDSPSKVWRVATL